MNKYKFISVSGKRKYIILILLVLSFLFLRLLFLLTSIDLVEEFEEKFNGALPKDILEGNLYLPIFDYQYQPWAGGNTITSFLTLIPFLLFGQSLISLKLVPLCFFSLGTMILWYFFLCRYFSERIGFIFGLLYTFSPLFFSKMNLMAWGNHNESNFFSIAIISLLYKLIYITDEFDSEDGEFKKFRLTSTLIFFGIVSGFALYFSYMCLVAVFTSFLLWLLYSKLSFFRNILLYFAGFIVGFMPWILYNYVYDLSGIYNFSKRVTEKSGELYTLGHPENLWGFILKFFRLIFYHIPRSFDFRSSIEDIIYFSIFLFCLLLILKRLIRYGFFCKENIFLSYPLVFFFAFTLNKIDININFNPHFAGNIQAESIFKLYKYRYLSPLYPFIFSIIAIPCGKWIDEAKSSMLKFLSIFCVVLCVLLGIRSNVHMRYLFPLWNQEGFNSLGKGLIYKGYDYIYIYSRIANRNVSDKIKLELISNLDSEYRQRAYEVFGIELGKEFDKNFIRITKIGKEISNDYKYFFYHGVGWGLTGEANQKNSGLDKVVVLINEIEVPLYKAFCFNAFGFEVANSPFIEWLRSPDSNDKMKEAIWSYLRIINNIPEEFKPFCFIGLGKFIAEHIDSLKPIHYEKLLNEIPLPYRRFICIGMAIEMGEVFRNDMIKLIKPHYLKADLRWFYYDRLKDVISFYENRNKKFFKTDQIAIAYEGMGLAVQKYFKEPYLLDFILSRTDKEYHQPLLKGTRGFIEMYSMILEEMHSPDIYYKK